MTAAQPLRLFWRVLSEAPRKDLLSLLVLMLLGSVLDGVGLLMLVPMLESLNPGNHTPSALWQILSRVFDSIGLELSIESLLAVFLLLVMLRAAVTVVRTQQNTRLQNRLVDRVRARCYRALLNAEWRWLVAGRRSDHASTLMNEVSQLGLGLMFGIQLAVCLISMAIYLLAAFTLSWMACALALGSGLTIYMLLGQQRKKALQLGRRMNLAGRRITGNIQESLSGLKLAKILGSEKTYIDNFEHHMGEVRREQLAFQSGNTLSSNVYQVAGAFMLAAFLYAGLRWLHTPTATLLTLVFIFSRLLPMLASAQQQFQQWLHALPSVERTYAMISEAEAQAEPSADTSVPIGKVETAIALEGVRVCYQNRNNPALEDIRLTLPSRTTTAVMGESGAGKSTLADVLMGLLDIDAGHFRVDGRDIRGGERLRWRKSVAYVPQDTFLFHDSIRNNMLWGNPDASDGELRQSLYRAAADFVFALPQGMDTVVGDGGILLSGGERQRIALARALLKKPALLILDEATSALDTGNETRIRKAIENLHGDLTVLIIGHRLPTLEHADQVIVMESGRIKAHGTWQEVAAGL